MNKLKILGAFIIGATIGAAGSYIFLKKRFDRELEDRIRSIKNTYEKVNNANSINEADTETVNETAEDEPKIIRDVPDAVREQEKLDLEQILKDEEYDIFDVPEDRPKMDWHGDPIDEDDDKGSDQDSAYEYYMDTIASYTGNEDHYIVTEEDYNANTYGHARKVYVMFDKSEDGEIHVMEENGEEIQADQWKDELGWDTGVFDMGLFGAYPDNCIYIRNEPITTDFCVHLSDLEWVSGIECTG